MSPDKKMHGKIPLAAGDRGALLGGIGSAPPGRPDGRPPRTFGGVTEELGMGFTALAAITA